MTSKDLEQITGKRHDNVLADIRKEIDALGENGLLIFKESSYTNSQNKEQPCYTFGRKGAMQLALKYDAVTRFKVIERLEELEKLNQPVIPTGTNLLALAILEADRMIKEKDKVIEAQNNQLEIQKPKVIFADAVEASIESILIRDFSKLLHKNGVAVGEKRLFAWLRENGFILKTANKPTQKAVELGVLELKEGMRFGTDRELVPCFTTKVTGKGQTYFMSKFLNEV
jgi:Rha family phage regulatory protein